MAALVCGIPEISSANKPTNGDAAGKHRRGSIAPPRPIVYIPGVLAPKGGRENRSIREAWGKAWGSSVRYLCEIRVGKKVVGRSDGNDFNWKVKEPWLRREDKLLSLRISCKRVTRKLTALFDSENTLLLFSKKKKYLFLHFLQNKMWVVGFLY
jgi:hypothetical protein